MLQQLVWSVLLLALVNSVTTHECLHGQVGGFDGTNVDTIQFCYMGEWRYICRQDSEGGSVWNIERAGYACTQLGYGLMNGSFIIDSNDCQPSPALEVVTLTNCTGPELTQCTVTPSEEYNSGYSLVKVWCLLANCIPGSLRLVGGTTEREGRVEVCVGDSNDRRWRTVCANFSQQLAGAVCAKLGYPFKVGTVVGLDRFPRGAYPEYRLSCELAGEGHWICEGSKEECITPVEYAVVCMTYEELCNECSSPYNPALTTLHNKEVAAPCSGSNAGIGVLVALLVAVTVGWIVTSVVLLRKIHRTAGQKQHDRTTITKLSTNQSYTQQEIQQHTADQTNMATDAYNRLNRNQQVQGYLIDDTTYDYADHNLVRGKSTSAPAHPPPVGGVSDDEFYNAEDHTYAAVPKKDKVKKKSAMDEENNS